VKGVASDRAGNRTETPESTFVVRKLGDTPGDLGTACSVDRDCNSHGYCFSRICTRACAPSDGCPTGFECVATKQFTTQCEVVAKPDDGCSATPPARRGLTLASELALGAILLALAWARRALGARTEH